MTINERASLVNKVMHKVKVYESSGLSRKEAIEIADNEDNRSS